MAEVCVAVGTLGAATDQSSCKTNLTLTNPLPHLLPPHHHQNSQFFTAKCTQHNITLINHPKQSMFNLWRAGLTRKFITCCRKTACASVSQASIYLWEMNKILERQSLQQRSWWWQCLSGWIQETKPRFTQPCLCLFMVDDMLARLSRLHLPKRFRDFSQAHL